ncbi:MAG: hypothetical protein CEE42_14595 [Promethearchaeota archaeon Loki_b31]|nr:MAG: hypothetical protein CEE42_14595 [Candidatus Lokiarchaeota archaeon Loki_b31]
MSENKALKLYRKGRSALKKMQYYKALDLFDQSLSINPEDTNTLGAKGITLAQLGRLEESCLTYSKANLIKLKTFGEDIPSDINSIEAWMDGGKELKKLGQSDRAFDFFMQAALLTPVVDKEGGLGLHHKNPELYYEIALLTFNLIKNYENAMVLFKRAIKYDPNLTIPEEIKTRYNEYAANRSGVGVKMIFPLNTSNIRDLIPKKDKILASTKAFAEVRHGNLTGDKVKIYRWSSHLLLCDNGIAFQGAKPMCKLPAYYLPWTAVAYNNLTNTFTISPKAAEIKHILVLTPHLDPQTKSFKYIQDLNLDALLDEKNEELLRRTVINLKSLEPLPSFKEYIKQFEYVPKPMYKKVIKTLKQDRK